MTEFEMIWKFCLWLLIRTCKWSWGCRCLCAPAITLSVWWSMVLLMKLSARVNWFGPTQNMSVWIMLLHMGVLCRWTSQEMVNADNLSQGMVNSVNLWHSHPHIRQNSGASILILLNEWCRDSKKANIWSSFKKYIAVGMVPTVPGVLDSGSSDGNCMPSVPYFWSAYVLLWWI